MKTILVPVDFSSATDAVLDQAADLAAVLPASVVLVHVTQPPVLPTEYGPLLETIVETGEAMDRSAIKQLERLRSSLAARYVAAEVVHRHGLPAGQILDEAAKAGADYIVVGSHGHTAFYDLLVGSTTHGILKGAKCPVVVVPVTPQKPKSKGARKRKFPG